MPKESEKVFYDGRMMSTRLKRQLLQEQRICNSSGSTSLHTFAINSNSENPSTSNEVFESSSDNICTSSRVIDANNFTNDNIREPDSVVISLNDKLENSEVCTKIDFISDHANCLNNLSNSTITMQAAGKSNDTDANVCNNDIILNSSIGYPDDLIFCDENTDNPQIQLSRTNEFRNLCFKHKLTRIAVNDILNFFKADDLKKDFRSIMKRPRDKVGIERFSNNGEYYYFGIANGLIAFQNYYEFPTDGVLKLKVNVDGVPLFESTKKSLWPILIQVAGNVQNEVIMVAAYWEGEEVHSVDSDEFIEQFVGEANLLIENGIEIEGKMLRVEILNFICDAPAKAFVLDYKGHTGYSSCPRCMIRGGKDRKQNEF